MANSLDVGFANKDDIDAAEDTHLSGIRTDERRIRWQTILASLRLIEWATLRQERHTQTSKTEAWVRCMDCDQKQHR
jgi:hypothetical protein